MMHDGWTALDYMDEINRLEKELKKHEWVSVKDRLPKEGIVVLVYGRVHAEQKGIDIDYVDESGDFYYYDKEITHWMPLPQKPESEDDDING